MTENNRSKENKNYNNVETGRESSKYLIRLANEYKEQINTLTFNQKYYVNLLNDKKKELSEQERTKAHNIDLFSPIYVKEDSSEVTSEIDDFQNKIKDLTDENNALQEKASSLIKAARLIDLLLEESSNKESTSHGSKTMNDIGLNILDAQEKERQRIARDLHDSTVQNLTSMVHKTELCIKLIDMDSIRAKLELSSMSNTIKNTINDMRNTIYNLKPMSLDDLGLVATVDRYVKQIMAMNDIKVVFHYNKEMNEILPVVNLSLFRVIQEACQNVIKHAMASCIEIDIVFNEREILITIKDDGKGFNLKENKEEAVEQSSNFGLSIMKERISLLSGELNIQTEEGKGTIVTISVPIA